MRNRKSLNRRQNNRNFRKGARIHRMNTRPRPMRGGTRL
jgi:hypothetical protein